jgi:hypothetical protein
MNAIHPLAAAAITAALTYFALPLSAQETSSTMNAADPTTASAQAPNTATPIDASQKLKPSDFAPAGQKGTWETKWQKAKFPFDELIYYWNARLERDEGFRLYLQVRFAPGKESPWLYAGFWGRVPLVREERKDPEFEQGKLEQDQLRLTEKATEWRFRLVSEGKRALSKPPVLGIITTDNHPTRELADRYGDKTTSTTTPGILDIALTMQQDSGGNPLKDRCQSAAVGAAMDYFGTSVPLEQIISFTTDPEYKSFGIWPRTINTAFEFGFDAYLDRFRDWEKVKKTVAENKVILCSITMPGKDTYIDPPYPKIGGHIVALCGVTDDGRVLVADSARRGTGYLEQWRIPDFEKIWIRNKGGVGMVVCPPGNFKPKYVKDIPPFPDYKTVNADAWTSESTKQ